MIVALGRVRKETKTGTLGTEGDGVSGKFKAYRCLSDDSVAKNAKDSTTEQSASNSGFSQIVSACP